MATYHLSMCLHDIVCICVRESSVFHFRSMGFQIFFSRANKCNVNRREIHLLSSLRTQLRRFSQARVSLTHLSLSLNICAAAYTTNGANQLFKWFVFVLTLVPCLVLLHGIMVDNSNGREKFQDQRSFSELRQKSSFFRLPWCSVKFHIGASRRRVRVRLSLV